jgi:hypothetical protein
MCRPAVPLTACPVLPQAALVLAMPLLSGRQDRSFGQLPTYGAILRGGLAYTASVLGALIAPILLGIARVLVLGEMCIAAARSLRNTLWLCLPAPQPPDSPLPACDMLQGAPWCGTRTIGWLS